MVGHLICHLTLNILMILVVYDGQYLDFGYRAMGGVTLPR